MAARPGVGAPRAAAPAPAAGPAAPTHRSTGGEFSADRLDLADCWPTWASACPSAPACGAAAAAQPRGHGAGAGGALAGPLDAPRSYSASASVQGLAIAAAPSPEPGGIGRPGWRGADLEFSATEAGGRAELPLDDGAVELPGVFEDSRLPLEQFATQLQWRIEAAAGAGAAGRRTEGDRARFDNADAEGALNATWRTGAGTGFGKGGRLPGVLGSAAAVAEAQAARSRATCRWDLGRCAAWVRGAVRPAPCATSISASRATSGTSPMSTGATVNSASPAGCRT